MFFNGDMWGEGVTKKILRSLKGCPFFYLSSGSNGSGKIYGFCVTRLRESDVLLNVLVIIINVILYFLW